MCSVEEKKAIDQIIDSGPRLAGDMDFTVLHGISLSHTHSRAELAALAVDCIVLIYSAV